MNGFDGFDGFDDFDGFYDLISLYSALFSMYHRIRDELKGKQPESLDHMWKYYRLLQHQLGEREVPNMENIIGIRTAFLGLGGFVSNDLFTAALVACRDLEDVVLGNDSE